MDTQTEVDNGSEMCEDDGLLDDVLNGQDAGRVFAERHIIDKINLFIDVYRREGYSEDFISGYIDGINEATGGSISLSSSEEVDEETRELLDNPPDSD